MSPEHVLPVLYDLSLSIGSEIKLKPLLTRFLRRLLYHTSFPAGIAFLDLSPLDQASGTVEARIGVVVGDYELLEQEGRMMRLPAALLSGGVAQHNDGARILESFSHGRYRIFLRLPIEGAGVIILLAPAIPQTELPLAHMFQPVLAHLANAVRLCRENEAHMAQIEAANKELDELSYSISHSMLQPLRAINGFAEILLEEHGTRLDEEGQRMLRIVRDSARHMGHQIDDILHFLRLGKQKMECSPADIGELAREVFAELQAAEPARGMRLETGGLPMAWGDREMLRLVLMNLLSNAVKFSPPDAEAVVVLSGTAEGKENIYSVKDHGVGFDMRYSDKLFRVFERVHPTSQYAGTGIGLAIVKRIIDRHRGRVWAQGAVGAGATFFFALPQEGQNALE